MVKKTEQNRCLLFLKNLEQVLTNGGQYQYQVGCSPILQFEEDDTDVRALKGMKYVRELEWEKEEMANVRKVVEAELAALQGKARI